MRILLINQYAGSPTLGMAHRPHWMATAWQAAGHDVLVVAGSHSHLRREQPHVGLHSVDGVQMRTLRVPSYSGNGIRRLGNIFAFRAQLRMNAPQFCAWRPDAVIASSTHPLDLRPAELIARRSGALFIFESHDLWPLTLIELGGMAPSHPLVRFMDREARFGYLNADLHVSILPNTLPYMAARGLSASKWIHIPNGSAPVTDPAALDESHRQAIAEFRSRHSHVLVYAGGMGTSNALDPLIDLLPELARLNVGLVLVGDGPCRVRLAQRSRGNSSVLWLPPVPRTQIPSLLALADFGYVGLQPLELYRHGVSLNKVYDYMAAGLPVLANLRGFDEVVEDSACGLSADPRDPTSLKASLREIVASSSATRARWSENGRNYVREFASQDGLAREFIAAISAARFNRGRPSAQSLGA